MTDTIDTTPATETKPLNAIQRAMALAKARLEAKKAAGEATPQPDEKPAKEKKVKDKKAKEPKAEPTKAEAEAKQDAAAIKRAEQLANREALKAQMAADRDARKAAAEAKLAEIAAAKEAKATERAAKKAERDAVKATKAAEREAAKQAKADAKAAKLRAKLPGLNEEAQKQVADIVGLFSPAQVAAIAAHLLAASKAAKAPKGKADTLEVGTIVRVKACESNPKAVGLQGRVTKSSKLRTFVDCGLKREAYCFTADLEVVAEEPEVAAPETPAAEEAAAE